MDKCNKAAALFLAMLKAMALIHQHNHWTTKGQNFYGDHLLFERLYKSVSENIDATAEKFIGLFGYECLEYDLQASLLNKILAKYSNLEGSPINMSLAIEKDFIKYCKYAHTCFEDENKLTLGLDDMITAISGKREEAVYLLSACDEE